MNPSHTPNQGVDTQNQAALDGGRFLLQRCSACQKYIHHPREFCLHCGGQSLEWVQPKGTGTIYAVTTVRRKREEGGDLNVSLIDLDEGVRLMSRVHGVPPSDVRIGERVRARVAVVDGRGTLVFDLMDGGRRDQQ
jgi:uncharacterized protein